MANESETPRPTVRPRVLPTYAGRTEPPTAANVVAITQEATGFQVTFFCVPADALDAPEVKEQIRAQEGKAKDGVIDVTLEAEPAAKLFLPITTVNGLIQLLSDNLRAWNDTYARELQNFLNVKAEGAKSGK